MMNILFGIQTTGNGHISRAQDILPRLMEMGQVTILLSGEEKEVHLPCHKKLRYAGLTYEFGKDGRISVSKTASKLQISQFFKDVQELELDQYDLILNDFEPVSAWAAKLRKREVISLSHQYSFTSKNTPRPEKKNVFVESLMKHFAPSQKGLGFHFKRYDDFILPPVIKNDVQQLQVQEANHFTVYLPAYKPEFLTHLFRKHPEYDWHLFSPQIKSYHRKGNIYLNPTSKGAFLDSLASCQGVITAGGFELCAESMFLGKKLFSIPIANQYEQLCNAAALRELGVMTAPKIGDRFHVQLTRWIEDMQAVRLEHHAKVDEIIDHILRFSNNSVQSQVA